MKFLLGADQYPEYTNGAANFTTRLAAGLAASGHTVDLLRPSANGHHHTYLDQGVRVHRLSSIALPGRPRMQVCTPRVVSRQVEQILQVARYRKLDRLPATPGLTVLFVGRLEHEKHVNELLSGFARLPESVRARLEIVGMGSLRARLQAQALTLGIRSKVAFAGAVSDNDLRQAYARADLFVMPGTAALQSLATLTTFEECYLRLIAAHRTATRQPVDVDAGLGLALAS